MNDLGDINSSATAENIVPAEPNPSVDGDVSAAAAQLQSMQAAWEKIVRDIIAKSKKIKPEDVVLPSEQAGRYSTFAFDNNGNFAVPRSHGRRRRHWSPRMNAQKSLALSIFKQEYGESLRVYVMDAAIEGKPLPEELGQQETIQLYISSLQQAARHLSTTPKLAKRDARRRARFSRRVNAGLVSPLKDRRSVSSGSHTWADLRLITQRKFNVSAKPKGTPIVDPAATAVSEPKAGTQSAS